MTMPDVKVTEAPTKAKPNKEQLKKVMSVVSEGIGAIRKGTYQGHDCVAIAELVGFLISFKRDMETEYTRMPETDMSMAQFDRPAPAPTPEAEPAGAAK